MDNKKRVIVDYKTLPEEILEGIATKYPYGYGENDIIKFRNAKGDLISAIRYETDVTIYMVKVSTQLKDMIKEYDIEDDYSSSGNDSEEDSFGSGFDGVDDEDDEDEDEN